MNLTDDMAQDLPDRFQQLELLGAGAMGQVFRAHDSKLDRIVAVKLLAERMLENEEILARFYREARIQSRIDHPHVVRIYEADVGTKPPYLVMEFIDGIDLEQSLKQAGKWHPKRITRFASELGSALDALHRQGVIHRDLKPANLMIRHEDQSAVVMDLGLASLHEATVLTRTGSLLGTPLYMAPEVILGGGWSPASDQYQLAVILFELATGSRLIKADSLHQLMAMIKDGIHTPWPEDLRGWPRFRSGLERALATNPKDRFPSCSEMAAAIRGEKSSSHELPRKQPLPAQPLVDTSWSSRSLSFLSRTSFRVRFWLLGTTVLILSLVWLLVPGSSGSPEEIRYQVIGDQLRVRFRNGSAQDIWLQTDHQTVAPGPPDESGTRTALLPHIPSVEALRARLVWTGGGDAWGSYRAEALAVEPSLELIENRQVQLRLLRPVTLAWKDPRIDSVPRAYPEGLLQLPAPSTDLEEWTLAWSEEGVEFSRSWNFSKLLRVESLRLSEWTRQFAPLETQKQRLQRPPEEAGTDRLSRERSRMGSLGCWIPVLLQRAESPAQGIQVLRDWQDWELSSYQGSFLGDPGEPLSVPEWGAGARSWDLPPWKEQEVRHLGMEAIEGVARKPDWIRITTATGKLLGTFKYIEAARSIRFHWPEHPTGRDVILALSLRVEGLDLESLLEIQPLQGSSLRLWHWPAELGWKEGGAHYGWMSLFLPANLAPPPGTPMEISLHSSLRPSAILAAMTAVRLSWKVE